MSAQTEREVESDAISNRQLLRLLHVAIADIGELRKAVQGLAPSTSTTPIRAPLSLPTADSQPPFVRIPAVSPQQQPAPPRPIADPTARPPAPPSPPTSVGDNTATAQLSASASADGSASRSGSHAPPSSTALQFTTHSVVLHGNRIVYDRDLLLAPPRHDYAANPELIADHWEHLKVSILPGQLEDIGLKHWKQIYKGTKHWKRLRKPYSQWAVKYPDAFLPGCHLVLTSLRFKVCCCRILEIPYARRVLGRVLIKRPPFILDSAHGLPHARADEAGRDAGQGCPSRVWRLDSPSCVPIHKSEQDSSYDIGPWDCAHLSPAERAA